MKRKSENITPSYRIVASIRRMWLRSRERYAALKAAGNRCQHCGVKASRAKGKEQKVEVHHLDGIAMQTIVEIIRDILLVSPDKLKVLCPECHKKEHKNHAQEKRF